MKAKKFINRSLALAVILNFLCFITGALISKATPVRSANPTVSTHAVLAENASPTW